MGERTEVSRVPVLRRWNLTPREAAILVAIVLATIAIYLPILGNGWVSDDWQEFVDNKLIHSWSFVGNSFIHDSWWFHSPGGPPQSAYYRPLENTWFAANALLFGTHPAPWHLAKIVLHVVVLVLCFRVAQLLTGDVAVGLLTAAIFGFMPAHVDGVAWASAIPEPLSTAFELGALVLLIGRKPGWSLGLFGSAILYGLAVLTHESAVLFPLIVAAYVILFEGRGTGGTGRRIVAAVRACVPFAIVTFAYIGARANALGVESLFIFHRMPDSMVVRGFVRPRPHYTALQVLMTLPAVLIAYLAVLALPTMAGPTHAIHWVIHLQPIVFAAAAALMLFASAAFVLAWRSSHRRIYLFCAAWSFITIAPALNLSALWSWTLVEDRYLYAPSFGWSLAVAVAAWEIAAAGSRARKAVGLAMAVLLVTYAASTMHIEHDWHDDVTYSRRCVEIAPYVPDYHAWLAVAMDHAGDFDGALREIRLGLSLEPDSAPLQLALARQYQKMGREVDFEREFQKFNELSAAQILRHQHAADSPGASPATGAP